ncbi:MAG: hypothetical protein IT384_25895 [Deltaproteobacteria bacterium]|nr:hypothetical protein [Deltaproteobacteria bacterium]
MQSAKVVRSGGQSGWRARALILSALASSSAALAAETSAVQLEQTALAFPLILDHHGARTMLRVSLPSAIETIVVARSAITLNAYDLPVILDRGREQEAAMLSFLAEEIAVDRRGRAVTTRRAILKTRDGAPLAELLFALELDLSAFEEGAPSIALPHAELASLHGLGDWEGARLINEPLLAVPTFPLRWERPRDLRLAAGARASLP